MLDQYVGIPWKDKGRGEDGCDCWGLVRLIYRDRLGIELPSYDEHYATAKDRETLSRLIEGELGPWHAVEPGKERPLDAILLLEGGSPRHIGVIAGDGFMLHMAEGHEAVIESYRSGIWRRRVAGIFRHESAL